MFCWINWLADKGNAKTCGLLISKSMLNVVFDVNECYFFFFLAMYLTLTCW